MPTYEYRCKDCGNVFDRVEHLAEHAEAHPICPKCQSKQVEPVPTAFYAKTARKS
jgi:putative FmdB family regulatory protein